MSGTQNTGGDDVEVELSRSEIRAAYNPFEHGCWLEFANKLTEGYMSSEPDPWSPLGDHHSQWLRHIAGEADADGDLALLCHRDGLKTTIITAYLIACLEYKPGFRAIWCMNTQEQAYEKADRELNKFIERNPWLINLNKPRKTDSKKVKEFHHDASLTTAWLFGAVEGARAHVLLHDDIIKERGDGSTSEVINWVDGVAQPMVKDDGRTIMVGTRKRPDDIWSHYRDYQGYALREYPAILDVWDSEYGEDDDHQERRPDPDYYTEVQNPWSNGTLQVLWPDARGPEWLRDKRSKMADHLFWREYTLTIRGASGNLINADDVNQRVEDGGCSIRGSSPPAKYRAGEREAIVVAHDPAQSPTGDDAAFVVFRAKADGTRTLLDARAEQGLQPSQIKAQLAEYDRRYDPAVIVIEDNGMQQYVVNDAIEFSPQLAAKVTGISTSGKKHSWENGIPRLRTLVENGAIQFYRGHQPSEEFVQAAMSLELQDGKLQGHTPDLVAAWYMAEQGMRRLAFAGADDDVDEDDDSNGVSYL
ncbi:hypothetical protein [Halobacterium sp. CBA1126]|uniref:phage terminase large subunit family protein n=1 Tax=Halobacterium sp. CBA1126 TaxID=2668074 RepID=UPI0012FA1FE0|nr:hypothetical protein [Halobacterium sp. CBA1126]MUV59986.1 hypothetical protein [Halobacterium sp. CBA1126]